MLCMVVVLLAVSSIGCRVSTRRSPPRLVSTAPSPTTPSAAQPDASPTQPPPPPPPRAAAVDQAARRDFLASLGSPGVGLNDQQPASPVTLLALENSARDEARGLEANTDIWTAVLATGQRAVRPVSLEPGHCVTFIAHGGLGVVELDLFLTVRGGSEVLAEDGQTGPVAVLGGVRRGRCLSRPDGAAMEADLHVRVRKGAGPVVARAFHRR